jgi:hypothetical protein
MPKSKHGPNAKLVTDSQQNQRQLSPNRDHAATTHAHSPRLLLPITSSALPRATPCTSAALRPTAEEQLPMESHSTAAPVLTPAPLNISHVYYSLDSVNSQPTLVQTIQNYQRPVVSVNNTTLHVHSVNSHPQQPTPVHISAPTNKHTVHTSPSPDNNSPPTTSLTA